MFVSGEAQLAEYKLYMLDGSGQIAGVPVVIEAPSDDQAIAQARERKKRAPAELWRGSRLIARLD
jgi:hypothetical protein